MENTKNCQFHIEIPASVGQILQELTDAGHEACIVGGCVRDSIIGRPPGDWDVCTDALPEETLEVFQEERTILTGLKHGTVTILIDGAPVEITTYRIDGEYLDGRHPEKVEFTRNLKEDLARRDFTINAMAYHPSKGVMDFYDGRQDLEGGIIRCVGEPAKRFDEDALRIMRGLRFAAQLGFDIEEKTLAAMQGHIGKLEHVSRERIQVELSKLLMGAYCDKVLADQGTLLKQAIAGLIPQPVSSLPHNLPTRLAQVFPKDTEAYLRQLKLDKDTIKTAGILAQLSQQEPSTAPIEMKQFLRMHGETIARLHYERGGKLQQLEGLLAKSPCYSVEHLAVDGRDLIAAGCKPGPALGAVLDNLLNRVIGENIENKKAALLAAAKEEIENE